MSIRRHLRPYFVLLIWLAGCGQHISQSTPSPTPIPAPLPSPTQQIAALASPLKFDQARQIDKRWALKFRFKTRSVSEKHDGYCPYEISAEYPEIVSRNARARAFNKWIKRKVLNDVARFRRLELRAEPRAKREGKRLLTEGLELSFVMYFSNQRLISIRLTHQVMAVGQMHPINYYETINYDLMKQRSLRARDVFRRGYLNALSTYSRKSLLETYQISANDWFLEGTEPRIHNFPNWNMVPDGLLISFEDYQINAHSFGQAELIVPFSAVRRVVKRSVLQSLLQKNANTRKVRTLVEAKFR